MNISDYIPTYEELNNPIFNEKKYNILKS